MNLSELSVKRPTLIVVIFTTFTFLGIISMRTLNYELLPKFSPPVFTVITPYPGASPVEVENSVSKRIEEVVSGLPNVDVVRCISQEGVSVVMVMLRVGAEVNPIVNEAIRKVQAVTASLPPAALEPSVTEISLDELPVLTLGVEADMPASELYDELRYHIEPQLSKIDGIGEITLVGGTEREIQVNLNHRLLDNYGLSILQIVQAIQTANFDFPAGKIENATEQTLLRMSSKFKKPSEIAELHVAQLPDGSLVKLRDIAEVTDTEKAASTLYRVNGTRAVGIQIKKKDDANTVNVSEAVKEEIQKIEQEYAAHNLTFSIPQDASVLIMNAAQSVTKDLVAAILLVTVIMVLFLHSARNALIVMITVPLALIASFIGMQLFDYTLNLMTLLALSLIIGTLVDDAIVVLENIYRHLEMGKSRWRATIDGVREVNLTVISTSLVLIVVFLPVALSESVISPIIEPFAMVVVITVLLSTFSALTLVPLLTSRFSKLEILQRQSLWGRFIAGFENLVKQFASMIESILIWSLRHKWAPLGLAMLLFVGAFGLVGGGYIGSEFVNAGDMGEGILTVEYPKNYTLKQNNLITRRMEAVISEKPDVRGIYTSVGSTSSLLAVQSGYDRSEINVKLVDKRQRTRSSNRIMKDLENELNATFPDVKVRSSIVSLIGGADENPIQIVFQGTNTDTLFAFAERMRRKIARIPGTNNVKLSIVGGNPELVIRMNKEKMARLGLSPEVVGATIQTAFSGNTDAKLQQGDFEYDINIRLDAFNRKSMEDVSNLICINGMGQPVKLSQFATVTEEIGSARLERYGRISSITLESQALGRSVGDVGADIQEMLNNTPFPAGMSYVPEGDLKYQDDAFGSLGIAVVIAIVLVYLVMVALYESYVHPFVVLFSIPLSVIGALLALALAQQTLSMFTLLGLIMLIGLVTKNAILVVDFTNTLRKEGNGLLRAIITAVRLRVRPILMTAVSTVVGMLPIALSQGAGSEWKNGIGWVLIGGMSSSMLLSLIVVPVVYLLVEQIREWFARIIGNKKAEEIAVQGA